MSLFIAEQVGLLSDRNEGFIQSKIGLDLFSHFIVLFWVVLIR